MAQQYERKRETTNDEDFKDSNVGISDIPSVDTIKNELDISLSEEVIYQSDNSVHSTNEYKLNILPVELNLSTSDTSKQKKLKVPKNKFRKPVPKRECIKDNEIMKYFDLKCDRCFDEKNEPIRFCSATVTRLHYKTVHKMLNRCNGICRMCDLQQTSASKMREHIRRHENPNEYQCKICGKEFQYSYVLKKHELSHEVETIKTVYFVCDICGEKALTLVGLTIHMRHRHIGRQNANASKRMANEIGERNEITCLLCKKVYVYLPH